MLTPKLAPPIDLLIIDAYYMLFRSYSSTPPLTTPGGFPTGAIHGFMGGLLNIIKELKPKHIILALEGGGNTERAVLDPTYKADRKPTPTPLQEQIPHIWNLCRSAGLQLTSVDGQEADDVIASICVQNPTLVKAIFTTDKDIISLTNETTFIVHKEKGKLSLLESADIKAKWGVDPAQIPEILCLCGDTIDNVPGIPGIGEKTATTLIQTWGSTKAVYANLESLTPKLKNLLTTHRDSYDLSVQLIGMNTSLEVPLVKQTPNFQVLEVLFDTVHMVKSKAQWLAWLNPPAAV